MFLRAYDSWRILEGDWIRNIGGLNDTVLGSVHITLKSETWEGSDLVLFTILTLS